MKTISISINRSRSSYPIIIGKGVISSISDHIDLQQYSQIVILTDTTIAPLWLTAVAKALERQTVDIVVSSGEKEKTIETVQLIWRQMLAHHCDRKSLVINLGGGVIGDMGGFAAATYMRGIDFIQIPTTLLAMVDASVGGKLGVDFEGYKNLIGSFAQPIEVLIDVETLTTLPDRQFIAGFAEIIKHGLIADKNYFDFVTSKKPRDFSQKDLTEIIERSCAIKAQVVEQDEQEAGLRKILNFGHTVGHAVESYSLTTTTPLLHGEAVAIGIVAEAKLSQLCGYIEEPEFDRIKNVLGNAGLPTSYKTRSVDAVREYMTRDKKNHKGIIKWTLLKNLGEATFDIEATAETIESAISTILL